MSVSVSRCRLFSRLSLGSVSCFCVPLALCIRVPQCATAQRLHLREKAVCFPCSCICRSYCCFSFVCLMVSLRRTAAMTRHAALHTCSLQLSCGQRRRAKETKIKKREETEREERREGGKRGVEKRERSERKREEAVIGL